jgi:hypothetical protein
LVGAQPLADGVEPVDLGTAVRVDHGFFLCLVRGPPVRDDGAVAVVVDGALLPGFDLPAVHRQLRGAQPPPEGTEPAAGVDRGELPVVADQDDLAAGLVGVVEQRSELAGAKHGGLVDHQHRPGVQLEPALP